MSYNGYEIKRGADLQYAKLQDAKLQDAKLQDANLQYADLQNADLQYADLQNADLRNANLQYADLQNANLRNAKLQGANLDFSCLPLWCGSFDMTVDIKFIYQLCYHICRLQCNHIHFKFIKTVLKRFANKFHRIEECGEIK